MTQPAAIPDAGSHSAPVALVTGAAHRIGACITRHLHTAGYRVIIHYNRSRTASSQLADELNVIRKDSAVIMQADLLQLTDIGSLAKQAVACWNRLDVLVNNASLFYPTPIATVSEENCRELMGSNAWAPLFLCQHLAPALAEQHGCIINLIDSTSRFGLARFTPYAMAKAALANMTRSLARELAPAVRVNGIAPGVILWPEYEGGPGESEQQERLNNTALGRIGSPEDIAQATLFLLRASYITGEIIRVDGGAALYC
jgi:pteridine reductase